MRSRIRPSEPLFAPAGLTRRCAKGYAGGMKEQKRKSRWIGLWILAGLALTNSCLTNPREHVDPLPGTRLGLFARDPVVRSVLARDLGLLESEAPGDGVLSVEAEMSQSRADVGRNLGLSLASGTTLAVLSVSADMRFELSVGLLAFPSRAFSARGRVGRYVFLPIYAGFIATALGSALEDLPRPEDLADHCFRGDASSCDDYRRLVLSAYDEIRPELRLWVLQQERKVQ